MCGRQEWAAGWKPRGSWTGTAAAVLVERSELSLGVRGAGADSGVGASGSSGAIHLARALAACLTDAVACGES
jgi:hypothetical protein